MDELEVNDTTAPIHSSDGELVTICTGAYDKLETWSVLDE